MIGSDGSQAVGGGGGGDRDWRMGGTNIVFY